MFTLPEYKHLEKMGEGDSVLVYRGTTVVGDLPRILRVFDIRRSTHTAVARFKNEYERIRGAGTDGLVRVCDVAQRDTYLVLVLEDVPGQRLDRLLGVRQLELEDVLKVAAAAAVTLGALHKCNITHGDLRPENVIVDLARQSVKLTGSGIERELRASPTPSAGEAAYLSPEVLGRMNRAADYRSDLYSLGVLLYDMLTGSPPFRSDDLLTLIHYQVARTPSPPEELNHDVPAVLSAIVMKLLAKAPEERYQSDVALHVDLVECLRRLEGGGVIEPFEIAREDVPQRFHPPHVLVGREAETATMTAAVERTRAGAREVVILRGLPGIGKSALAWSLQAVARRQGCRFVSAKFGRHVQEHPYSAVKDGLEAVFLEILASGPEVVRSAQDRLLEALGPNTAIALDLLPCLEHLVGPQPPAPETSPQSGQNRLRSVLTKVIEMSCADVPLVVFLDDLQWADAASIDLLEQVLASPELRNFLLVGAYRDSEVGPNHLLSTHLKVARELVPMTEIVVPPLSKKAWMHSLVRC